MPQIINKPLNLLIILSVLVISLGFFDTTKAQTSPLNLPRADLSGMRVLGKFSVPGTDPNGNMINYGGSGVGVSEDGKYLYVACRQTVAGVLSRGLFAKIEIPPIGGLGKVVQPCTGLSNTDLIKITGDPSAYFPTTGGIMERAGRLIVNGYVTYDTSGIYTPRKTFWSGSSLNSLSGPYEGSVLNGLVKSSLLSIPTEWRALLKGDSFAIAGYTSIISRASYGDSFTSFNWADVTRDGFSMNFLLGCPYYEPGTYNYLNKCISRYGGTQSINYYNGSEQSGGAFIVPGTRTLLHVVREALGPTCYGYSTRDQSLQGQKHPEWQANSEVYWCYSLSDPLNEKGPKGYPYQLVARLFDLTDLVSAANGTKKPWDIDPYSVVYMPGSGPNEMIGYTGGGTYNTATGHYYLTREFYPNGQNGADITVYGGFGAGSGGGTPTPSITPTPTFTPTPTPTPTGTPMPGVIVGHWKLDEGSGTTTIDSSGNGNSGLLSGGAYFTSGKLSGGVALDGVDDYIGISNHINVFNPVNISISAWVKPATIPNGGIIVGKGDSSEYYLRLYSDSFTFLVNVGGTQIVLSTPFTFNANTWYHLVGTYDGAVIRGYINGNQLASRNTPGTLSATFGNLMIGRRGPTTGNYFGGIVDDIRLYSGAISATEVQALYSLGNGGATPTPNPTPTPTASATPTPRPTPTVTPTPTFTPTPTPTHTPDIIPPIISEVSVTNITSYAATINWNTNEPANGQVEFCPTYRRCGNNTPLVTALTTGHTINLSGLAPNKSYYYWIKSRDASGNLRTSYFRRFRTTRIAETASLTISPASVSVTNTTPHAATIFWTTNKPLDGQIEFCPTPKKCGNNTPIVSGVDTQNLINLSGLLPNKLYHYWIKTLDASGNLNSQIYRTFRTEGGGAGGQ